MLLPALLILVATGWWWSRQRLRRSVAPHRTMTLAPQPPATPPFRPPGQGEPKPQGGDAKAPLVMLDSPAHQDTNEVGRPFARALMSGDTGVWRPLARETLLRRQHEEDLHRASHDDPSRRLEERRRKTITHPPSRPSIATPRGAGAARTSTLIEQAPPSACDDTRPSRLGRKRQGLDSLITALPPPLKESSRES